MSAVAVPGRMKAKAKAGGLAKEGYDESLIPGIFDTITLGEIVPKLPWKVFYVLSMVSPAWRNAIRSRQVYNVRVRSQSLEKLLLLYSGPSPDITLYSFRDDVYHRLPPVPGALDEASDETVDFSDYIRKWKCIALDGKVYLLGKVQTKPRHFCTVSMRSGVYELDLAGQGQWKECARMGWNREEFACGAMDGKIYVFQGVCDYRPVRWSEFYDPKIDAWSPLSLRMNLRFGHKVATVGEEFFLHGGVVFDSEYLGNLPDQEGKKGTTKESDKFLDGYNGNFIGFPNAVEVYNPIREDLRVQPLQRQSGVLFTAYGKIYAMDELGIDIYDTERNSWTNLHSHSLDAIELDPAEIGAGDSLSPFAVLAVDDELFAIVGQMRRYSYAGQMFLIRSRGLGGENKEIGWQKIQDYPPSGRWRAWLSPELDCMEMCPIQL